MSKNISAQQKINDEIFYGIIPITKKNRLYNFRDTYLVTAGYGIATFCYVQGATVGNMLGLPATILSTLGIASLFGMLLCMCLVISTRYGVDLWYYLKTVFGHKGVNILMLIAIACLWGYGCVNCDVYGNSVAKVINAALGTNIEAGSLAQQALAMTCILFGWLIAMRGPVAVKKATRFMVPLMLAVGVIMVIMVFSKYSISELMAYRPEGGVQSGDLMSYALVLEWTVAFIVAWIPGIGSLPRLCKDEKVSIWGNWLGTMVTMGVFICIGAVTSLAMQMATGIYSDDPTDWLIYFGGSGLGLLSLIVVVFANISTQILTAYVTAVSTKIINPKWNYKVICTAWSIYSALFLATGLMVKFYTIFVSVVGVACAPIIGIALIDFFILRKQKVSLDGLYQNRGSKVYNYTGGFNLVGVVCYFIGILSYVAVYNPLTASATSAIFSYTTATGLALITSGVAYFLLSLIPSLRSYLLKDRDDPRLCFLNKVKRAKAAEAEQ